ncbi:MAG: phosphoserine transaminase [Rhodospirillaceae bacterium]
MSSVAKPNVRPSNPNFSSGPCAKRPGWSVGALSNALVGRSHRAKSSKARIQEVSDRSRSILGLPESYHIGIVPASDTGAMEMAMWSMLGERGVDILAWESFGFGWVTDVVKQLKLDAVRILEAGYGELPDIRTVDFDRDVIFTWNGTTSGVRVPNADWIPADRAGLTFCDATSAIFAMEMDWSKLDVVTYSWQKVLGGEAQHGMLILSPRAVSRLESYSPPWPMPKLFRMTKNGKFDANIFSGATINTVSMLCVEDAVDSLKWIEGIGGGTETVRRSEANLKVITDWVEATDWIDFLAVDPNTRSCTSICLKIVADWFINLDIEGQITAAKMMVNILEEAGVAYDIGAYRDAPPGLRIWGGATIEVLDIEALCPWLDWAYRQLVTKWQQGL